MSSARTNSRTTSNSKTASLNPHQTNGANNSYDINEATSTLTTYSTGNNSKFDPSGSRSNLVRNVSQYDGIYRNARFIHAMTTGLIGQQVVIQTSDHERFHGVLETLSPNADVVLTVSHRLDTNNNDILNSPTLPLDLVDTIDSSSQTFELHKRIIKASNIVELIAIDIDLSNNAKCLLDETPKVSQLEDDRFSRMQHFYGTDEIDPETLEDLELGDDGKAGFDPEDMFHTNREKFNATTDFDESKYTNVPLRALSEVELAEIEKKVQDIERRGATEDIDEDDAGVKRPTEHSNLDEGNSNTKASRSNRNDFRIDTDYNPPKRENWRDQRSTGNTNRRGSGINSKQNQYNSTNNRQQYNNRNSRNARYTDNQSTYEQRDLTLQTTNEEPTRNQRMNSGNFSQGQTSGPTSPSGTVSGRTIYSNTHRSAAVNRNSPVPYTGSSSSRKNSVSNTTSPPNQQSASNKITRKQSIHEQQPLNDEQDQQRNSNSLNRPSQLQTKQTLASSSTINSVSSTLGHTNQEDNSSSHGTNQSNSPNLAKANGSLNPDADEFVPVFSRESSSRPESRGGSTTSSISTNTFNQHTHPQTIHPLHSQHPTPPVIPVTHPPNPAAAALYQQYYQAQYANLAPFINATTQPMTVGVMGAPIIPSQSLVSSGANTSNSNNGGSSGMTTPNSSVSGGPTYKGNNNNNNNNNNQPHNTADNTNNTGVSNVQSKKAVVSVQRAEQPTTPQPIPGATPMVYPAPPIRFYTPEYLAAQQGTATPMAIPQFPFYYSVNPGLIPTGAGVGQPQNIMIPTGTSSAGGVATGLPTIHYPGIYADPRMYNLYASTAVNSNWQLPRSPPQQQQQQQQPQGAEQQQQQQQRNFDANQNISNQQTSSTGASNTGNRPTSGSGQTGTANSGNSPAITPQYPLNGAIPPPFHYGAHTAWIPAPQQLSSSQANLPHQMNAAYNVIYDQIQQIPTQPQQAAYLHANAYDTSAYFAQQSQQSQQQQQQQVSQQSLDTMQQGNYNR